MFIECQEINVVGQIANLPWQVGNLPHSSRHSFPESQ